jgi:tetratricopeptide (TPR) repeat protein
MIPVLHLALSSFFLVAAAQESFWLETARFPPPESEAIASAVARMAEGKKGLVLAARREDARFFLRLRLGAQGEESDGFLVAGSAAPTSELDLAEASGPTAIARVDLSLTSVLDGEILFERSLKCQLPLAQRNRLLDPALRANLSHVVDVMAKARKEASKDEGAAEFGPSEQDRKRLSGAELARALSDGGSRARKRGYEEAALNLFAEAQPLFKELGLRKEEGAVWERLAGAMAATGRPLDRALDYTKMAVRIAQESGDARTEARSMTGLAALEARALDYGRSLELLQSARRHSHDEGDVLTEAVALANLAGVTALRGSFDAAHEKQQEALALARTTNNRRAIGRLLLGSAVIQSRVDARDRAKSLELVSEARRIGRETRDLALERDAAFVAAKVRFGTTDLRHLLDGELDAIRALQLSRRIGDRQGEAAGLALLGAFSHRLVRPESAAEYLALAQREARAASFMDIAIDTLQLLGEIAPDAERGLTFLEDVVTLRRAVRDLRGEVKTLSDMCRLHAGLEQDEPSQARCREALDALERYVEVRTGNPFAEDVHQSFLVSLKSLMTTRTELPYLESYLAGRHVTVVPDPTWEEGTP